MQAVPNLAYDGSTYGFSTLRWCKSNAHSVETILWILNFDLPWASNMRYDPPSWYWAATASQAPLSHAVTRVNNKLKTILYPYSRSVFHFQYSIQ